ncbi:unnamed protein product [Heligmosomoides polygyrus]|uniref:Uncharacterized protein n=1 Tax=Heligmosomoides polygyrus TaxID=6339 RepID=A0A183FLJ4_HELPZ|nr:unnamed protein product [Heligmosomoides polygyrus]
MDGDKKKSVASASDLSLPAPTKEEKPALPNATPTSDCSTLKSSSDSRLSSDRDETSTPPKESAPRMTVRLLRDRSARPSGPVLRTRSSSSEPKRPVPLSNSNAADASPSSNSPKTTPPTGRCSPKRCARRALKFD